MAQLTGRGAAGDVASMSRTTPFDVWLYDTRGRAVCQAQTGAAPVILQPQDCPGDVEVDQQRQRVEGDALLLSAQREYIAG